MARHSKRDHGEIAVILFMLCAAAFVFSLFGGSGTGHKHTSSTSNTTGRSDPASVTIPASELAVWDGDQLVWRGHPRLRLADVDAPSVSACYGPQAQQHLAGLVGSVGQITITLTPQARPQHQHFAVAQVTRAGENLGVQMVADGYATAAVAHGSDPEAAALRRAQTQARSAQRGLWAACPKRTG